MIRSARAIRRAGLLSVLACCAAGLAGHASLAAAPAAAPCDRATASAPGVLHAAGDWFASPDGRAVYLAGNHTWVDGQDIGPAPFDFAAYLALLRREDANLVRLWTWQSGIDGGGSYGRVAPLPYARTASGKFDLGRFNQAYFDRLRSEVEAAGAKGLYVSVMLFNGWSVRSDGSRNDPWRTNPFNAANNVNGIDGDPGHTGMGLDTQTLKIPAVWAAERRYIAKVVQTVADLPNVLFEVSNESTGSDADLAWQDAVVDDIRRLERAGGGLRHPVGISAFDWFNAAGPWRSQDYVNARLLRSDADWIAPTAGDHYRDDPPDANGRKVVIVDTDHVFGIGGDVDWVWRQFTRGNNVLVMDDLEGTGIAGLMPGVRLSADRVADEMSERLGITETRRVSMLVGLAGMRPADRLASTGFALADPSGGRYVVYSPHSGRFTVDLSAASGKTLRLRWMDVGTGRMSAPATIAGGPRRQPFDSRFGPAALVLTPGGAGGDRACQS